MTKLPRFLKDMMTFAREQKPADNVPKNTEDKKPDTPSADELRARKREKFQAELQAIREAKMRPVLRAEFKRIASALHDSTAQIGPYQHMLEKVLKVLDDDASPFITLRTQQTSAAKMLEYYQANEDLILRGTSRLSNEEHAAYRKDMPAKTGQKWQELSQCFRGDHVIQNIQPLFPQYEISYTVFEKSETNPQHPKSPLTPLCLIRLSGISGRQKKAMIGVSDERHRIGRQMHNLNDKKFAKALQEICRILIDNTPEYREDFVAALQTLRTQEETLQRFSTEAPAITRLTAPQDDSSKTPLWRVLPFTNIK